MTVEGAIRQPQRMSNRVRLTLFLVPMALAFSSAQVAKAVWPTLLTEAPWTLLAMSSNTTRMLLVQPLVPAHVFFGLALGAPVAPRAALLLLRSLLRGRRAALGRNASSAPTRR